MKKQTKRGPVKKVTAKRKPIKKQIIVDGKVDVPEKKDLIDIIGDNRGSKYGSKNLEQYRKEIESMDSSALYEHAIQMGLIPIDNRRILLSRLEKEYHKQKMKIEVSQSAPALEGDRAKKFLDILNGTKRS